MDLHVFKLNGPYTGNGFTYDAKCIRKECLTRYLEDGWVQSLDDLESGSDYEAELREKIKALTGKSPGGNCKIATLEKMMRKAESDV